MFFGGGGFAGNILIGLVMTFGPMAKRRFALFVGNNLILLITAGKCSTKHFRFVLFVD